LLQIDGRPVAQGSRAALLQRMAALERLEKAIARDRNPNPSRYIAPATPRMAKFPLSKNADSLHVTESI